MASCLSLVCALLALPAPVCAERVDWTPVDPPITGANLNDVWGSSATNVFTVGANGTVLHFNGSTWSHMASGVAWPLHAVWGSGPSDVYAGGHEGLLHYDGSAWTSTNVIQDVTSLWGSGPNDVFAATGEGGMYTGNLMHYNGVTWTSLAEIEQAYDVWSPGGGDAFVVSRWGTIYRRSGGLGTLMPLSTRDFLRNVTGTSATNVFAVGDHGTVLRYDGNTWSTMLPPTVGNLYAAWCVGPNDLLVAGSFGAVLRYRQNSWTELVTCTEYNLNALWGTDASNVFAVGDGGTILHFDGAPTNIAYLSSDDPDRDGYPNIYEAFHSTDPTNALSVPAASLYVDASAPVGGDGSAGAPFHAIQDAVTVASDYAIIQVADGMYRGVGNQNIDLLGKSVLLMSTNGSDNCILTAENAEHGIICRSGESKLTIIDGLTILDADSAGILTEGAAPTIRHCVLRENIRGIAALSASATITNCTISHNHTGIYCDYGSPIVSDCLISDNTPACGIYNERYAFPLIRHCLIRANGGWNGAGIEARRGGSCPTLVDCTITENVGQDDGGGVDGHPTSSYTLLRCRITENTSPDEGGGVRLQGCTALIAGCVIAGNTSPLGAGMQVDNESHATVRSTYIENNEGDRGAGIFVNNDSVLVLENSTMVYNSATLDGGGLYGDEGTATVVNCILWGNTPNQIQVDAATVRVSYSCLQGGYSGNGNTAANPQLVTYGSGPHLSVNSPCIDAGNDSVAPLVDFEDEFRWDHPGAGIGAISDIGADEFVDSDVDGMADSWEMHEFGTLATNSSSDPDGDGLTTIEEYGFGTNPLDPDTDDDGLDDHAEIVTHHTDPVNADTDADGMNDGLEIQLGFLPTDSTSPGTLLTDADNDGFYRGYELTHGSNPDLDSSVPSPDIYVDPLASAGGDGSQESPFANIAAALAAADDFDIIHLAAGLYTGPNNRNLECASKRVMIFAPSGRDACIVDCQASGRGIRFSGGTTRLTVLRGVTIRNASRSAVSCEWANPTITACRFISNTALAGGGLACYSANIHLSDCEITDNMAQDDGGGLFGTHSDLYVTNCTFAGNAAADNGGGVRCRFGTAQLLDCVISNNAAGGDGGGLHFRNTDALAVGCTIVTNVATDDGGGVAWGVLTNCYLSMNRAFDRGGAAHNAELWGCVVTNNRASGDGGGVSRSLLTSCTLVDNTAGLSGGGAYTSVLSRCTVAGNYADVDGGGAAHSTLTNCVVGDNTALNDGGGAYECQLRNCAVVGNSAGDDGGGAQLGLLYNCTVAGNTAVDTGGGIRNSTAYNCIVYHNAARIADNHDNTVFTHSCTTPDPGPTNNITDIPLLATMTRLAAESPCRSAGSALYAAGTDIHNQAWGTPPDMGCDEYVADPVTGPLHVALKAVQTNTSFFLPLTFTADIDGDATHHTWSFGDGHTADNQPSISHAWSVTGVFPVVVTTFNADYPAGVSDTITVRVTEQTVCYVDAGNSAPAYPYAGWATAATNIQDAINAGNPGSTVVVTDGVYTAGCTVSPGGASLNRVVLSRVLAVRSVNGPAVTRIVGAGPVGSVAIRCAYLAPGTILDGFTLTNGHTLATGDSVDINGGGVFMDEATLTNCVVVGNHAQADGGGTYMGTLHDCRVRGNYAGDDGGGVFRALVKRCTITENTANDKGGGVSGGTLHDCTIARNQCANDGGGANSATLSNCVVTANNAGDNGGGAADSTLVKCVVTGNYAERDGGGGNGCNLDNCIVADNEANDDGGGVDGGVHNNCTVVFNRATDEGGGTRGAVLTNCIVYCNAAATNANYAGGSLAYCCASPNPGSTGCIMADPQLTATYRLKHTSPCIDAGEAAGVPTTDIDNEARWDHPTHVNVFSTTDIGADEFVDTDMDDLPDNWEWAVLGHMNAAGADDPDEDGLNHAGEYGAGSDPSLRDTDGDGAGDGHEIGAGTSPVDPAQCLRIVDWHTTVGREFSWDTVTNRFYTVQTTTDPCATWSVVPEPAYSNMSGTGLRVTYTNDPPFADRVRLFRVMARE